MSEEKKYDYIFAGAGLAGLSLAYKLKKTPGLKHKKIALVDPSEKNSNDRTWCFWSREKETFDHILHKRWPRILFASDDFQKDLDIDPYNYKMIRGLDFYKEVIPFLEKDPGTTFYKNSIDHISEQQNGVAVHTSNGVINGEYVFKSYYDKVDFGQSHFVWQHFKGLVIQTEQDSFDESQAIFMDFRVDQDDETRFFYVLPFDKKTALVEIAIFSGSIPEPEFYDAFISDYIKNVLKINQYNILETELGAIPMTTYNFGQHNSEKVIHIGTGGGSVKPSSGYAFKRIQEETDRVLDYIKQDKLSKYRFQNNRYQLYDRILLNAILSNKTTGKIIFEKLFKKIRPQTIFKFLDEKGGFFNDIKIFTAPPTLPFFRAFLEEIFKR